MSIRNQHSEIIDHAYHPAQRDDVLVVFGHGVTANKDRPLMVELATRLASNGWPCLRISFAGNGQSEGGFGDATITKEVADFHAVLDQVKGSKEIVYIGHSMGAAVGAIAAALDDRISVLVSLAGMVNTRQFCETEFGDVVPDQGCMWEEPEWPLSQKYVEDLNRIGNTLAAAKGIRAPWLMLHGDRDDVVLPKDSEDLYATLTGEKKHVVISGADHCFEGHYDQLVSEIDDWLTLHLKRG